MLGRPMEGLPRVLPQKWWLGRPMEGLPRVLPQQRWQGRPVEGLPRVLPQHEAGEVARFLPPGPLLYQMIASNFLRQLLKLELPRGFHNCPGAASLPAPSRCRNPKGPLGQAGLGLACQACHRQEVLGPGPVEDRMPVAMQPEWESGVGHSSSVGAFEVWVDRSRSVPISSQVLLGQG